MMSTAAGDDEDTHQVVYKFDDISSNEGSYTNSEKVKKTKLCYGLLFLIVIAALATITAGVVLLRSARENQEVRKYESEFAERSATVSPSIRISSTEPSVQYMRNIRDIDDYCAPSEEAQRIHLAQFLQRCQQLYFRIYPHQELLERKDEPQSVLNGIVHRFTPYLPTPSKLKETTDQINELRKQIDSVLYNESEMKPKENQMIAKIKVFLSQMMSVNFESGFYDGGWMFGPEYFCFNRVCRLQEEISILTYYYRPKTYEDLETLYNIFLQYNQTFHQNIENLKMGIKSGMIKSRSACEAGIKAFEENNKDILFAGARKYPIMSRNILNSVFYSQLDKDAEKKWRKSYGHSSVRTLYSTLLHGFIFPARKYHRFLQNEYLRQCPPDHVATGLSHLPVMFQYLDGKPNFTKPTTMKLPLTGGKLDGKRLYSQVLKRYTTLNVTSEEVHQEGIKQLDIFYPKLVNIAKNLTGSKTEDEAISKIKSKLSAPNQFHGPKKFPEVESNTTAYARCKDEFSARKYCPIRWKSMEKWKNYLNRIMAMIHPLLNDVFHFTGEKVSVPNCPIEIRPHFNPTFNSMYEPSDAECTTPTVFALPFFADKYGPKFQEWSIAGHEARPGHNFQIQGAVELFASPCGDKIQSFFNDKGFFSGFVEGWASYAENPVLSDDVMLYENNRLQKLGMYKWQVWRAIRLIIDSGLHSKDGQNMDWALNLLKKYALDDGSDFSRKEVIRYMSEPGQAASYMMGRLEFIKARERVEKELRHHFNIKDFHYQVLSLGPVPLSYLPKYIERYLGCLKDPLKKYCEYIFTPLKSIPKSKQHKSTHAHYPRQLRYKESARFLL
eukprot:TCONS_00000989-protein